jgi:hypothetical protein
VHDDRRASLVLATAILALAVGDATTSSDRGGPLAMLVVLLVVGGSLLGKALVQ